MCRPAVSTLGRGRAAATLHLPSLDWHKGTVAAFRVWWSWRFHPRGGLGPWPKSKS